MGNAEAVDLVRMLPDGSRWVARVNPLRSWGEERHRCADLVDAIKELTWGLLYDRDRVPTPPTVVRPRDVAAREAGSRRAAMARRSVEAQGWEEM